MSLLKFYSYKIIINEYPTTIDVAHIETKRFLCLLNKDNSKDFINGLKARGFFVDVKDFSKESLPIYTVWKTHDATELSEELMQNIWQQVLSSLNSETF